LPLEGRRVQPVTLCAGGLPRPEAMAQSSLVSLELPAQAEGVEPGQDVCPLSEEKQELPEEGPREVLFVPQPDVPLSPPSKGNSLDQGPLADKLLIPPRLEPGARQLPAESQHHTFLHPEVRQGTEAETATPQPVQSEEEVQVPPVPAPEPARWLSFSDAEKGHKVQVPAVRAPELARSEAR